MYLEHMKLRYTWGRGFRASLESEWIPADVPGLPVDGPPETRPRPATSACPSAEIASIERARCATDGTAQDARQNAHYIEFQRRRVIDKPDGWKQFNPSYSTPKRRKAA